jgi:Tol biopolymer transport system component
MTRSTPSRCAAVVAATVAALAGCTVPQHYIECQGDSDCGLQAGGKCLTNDATGHQFCAYPDPSCPDGYRWSTSDVESSISGVCVAQGVADAGVADATVDSRAADAPSSGCSLKVVFSDGPDQHSEVYIANSDGTGITNISNNQTADDGYPDWSPLGDKIAFETNRDGNYEIYVADPTGANLQNLTSDTSADRHPRWSPDGSRIAYNRNSRLYVMDANGANKTEVATLTITNLQLFAWAPDNQHLVFESVGDIYVADITGGQPIRITTDGTAPPDYAPTWSPDGNLIAYSHSGTSGDSLVVRAPAMGSTATPLTTGTWQSASWAADSMSLLITMVDGGAYDVSTVNLSTHNVTPISTDPNSLDGYPPGGTPSWSPDGQLITYARRFTIPNTSTTTNEIAVIHANGTNLKRFNVSGNASFPRWSPCLH